MMPGYASLVADNFCVAPRKPARSMQRSGPMNAHQPSLAQTRPSSGCRGPCRNRRDDSVGNRAGDGRRQARGTTHSGIADAVNRAEPVSCRTPVHPVSQGRHADAVARAANKTFAAGDIPALLVERLAWIVGRPETHYVYPSDMDSPGLGARAGRVPGVPGRQRSRVRVEWRGGPPGIAIC
jgi:hypothetical protein